MKEIRVYTGEAEERTSRASGKTYKLQPAQAFVVDSAGTIVAMMNVEAFSDGLRVGAAEERDLSLTFNERGELRSQARSWKQVSLLELVKSYPAVGHMLPAELRNTRQPAQAAS